LWLALGSFFGVLVGVGGLFLAPDWLIRFVFAAVLLYTSYRLYTSPVGLNQSETKQQPP